MNYLTKRILTSIILIFIVYLSLSNFLLWQCSYTEIYFEKKLWPDFNRNDFTKILTNFSKVRRNFGGIK